MIFEETNKYKNKGHFFYNPGDNLSSHCEDIPDLPGVFYILKLARGKIELVYIGKSQNSKGRKKSAVNSLKESIIYFPDGKERQTFLAQKMFKEKIEALDIYWFVTMDKANNHLPEYVEGLFLQKYYDLYEELPDWNGSY